MMVLVIVVVVVLVVLGVVAGGGKLRRRLDNYNMGSKELNSRCHSRANSSHSSITWTNTK
jgi:hypothetical protein